MLYEWTLSAWHDVLRIHSRPKAVGFPCSFLILLQKSCNNLKMHKKTWDWAVSHRCFCRPCLTHASFSSQNTRSIQKENSELCPVSFSFLQVTTGQCKLGLPVCRVSEPSKTLDGVSRTSNDLPAIRRLGQRRITWTQKKLAFSQVRTHDANIWTAKDGTRCTGHYIPCWITVLLTAACGWRVECSVRQFSAQVVILFHSAALLIVM